MHVAWKLCAKLLKYNKTELQKLIMTLKFQVLILQNYN